MHYDDDGKYSMPIFTDRDGKTTNVDVDQIVIEPRAYGIVIQDDKILLIPERQGYDLPGGGVEKGETLEEGLKRELFEETGIKVEIEQLVEAQDSFYWFHDPAFPEKFVQSICLFYLCKKTGGELTVDHQDAYEQIHSGAPIWHPIENLDEITWIHTIPTRPIIDKALTIDKKQQKG